MDSQSSALCLPQATQGGYSLTPEQIARMDRHKAMALSRLKARQQENLRQQENFMPVQSSALCVSQGKQDVLSLTPEQRARIDHQKAMALARRKARLEQQCHTEILLNLGLTHEQSMPSSQQDKHLGIPPEQGDQVVLFLTPGQRARIDHQKAMALARRKARLEQWCHEEILLDPWLTHEQSAPSSQHDNQASIHEQSNQSVSSLTPEQRARIHHQKMMALARRKTKLEQQHCEELLLNRLTQVQSTNKIVTIPDQSKQGASSLTPEQRARMDRNKAMALAKRKARLEPQPHEELLSNQPTYVQSTPSSQQVIHVSTLVQSASSQQDNYSGAALSSANSAIFSQQDVYSGSAFACRDISLPTQQELYDAFDLTSTSSAQSLQQEIYGSATFSSTHSGQFSQQDSHSGASFVFLHSALSSQQDRHGCTVLTSVQNPLSSQQDNQDVLALSSVQSPLSVQHDSHGGSALTSVHSPLSSQQNSHNSSVIGFIDSAQHDDYGGSSLTFEQRAHMACQKEKALARLRGKLQQTKHDQHPREPWISQCAIANIGECTNDVGGVSQISPQQDSDRKMFSTYAQNVHQSGSLLSSGHDTCSGSSLTFEKRARMAHPREMAIARQDQCFGTLQQDQHHYKPQHSIKGE